MNPLVAASSAQHAAQCFVNKINDAILFPLITLLMALAFLIFLYGCFEYVRNAASDQGRQQGQQHILYGTIGMLVMLSAYAILSLAAGTFNIPLFPSDSVVCSSSGVSTPSVSKSSGFGSGVTTPSSPGFGGGSLPGGSATSPSRTSPSSPGGLGSVDGVFDDLPDINETPPCTPSQPMRMEDGSCAGSPAVGISGQVPVWSQAQVDAYLSYGLHKTDSALAEKREILNDPQWDGATQVLFTMPINGSQTYAGPAQELCEDITGISGNNMNIDKSRNKYVCFNYNDR